jgi:hypothetical protein
MEINIPTSLKDITMRQFMAFEKSGKTDDDYIIHLCDFANPKLLPRKEYTEIVTLLKEVMASDVIHYKIFKHDGIQFGFIPDLDKITANETIHIEEFLKTPDNWNKALSVFYRPVTKRKRNWFKRNAEDLYDILPYQEGNAFEKLMLDVSCTYYLGAMVFFYNLGNDLLKYMQDYSKVMEEKVAKKKNVSTKNGGGMLA